MTTIKTVIAEKVTTMVMKRTTTTTATTATTAVMTAVMTAKATTAMTTATIVYLSNKIAKEKNTPFVDDPLSRCHSQLRN